MFVLVQDLSLGLDLGLGLDLSLGSIISDSFSSDENENESLDAFVAA